MSSGRKPPQTIDIGDLEYVSLAGNTDPKPPSTSSTPSSTKPMELIQSTETSSAEDTNIFSTFFEIKQKNESLKSQVYNKFWKQTSTSQHRLLSAFDSERGRMKMAFLQAQIPFPKSTTYYKKTIFSFDVNQIHPIDQMDLHRQSGEMLFSIMTTNAMYLCSKPPCQMCNHNLRLKNCHL